MMNRHGKCPLIFAILGGNSHPRPMRSPVFNMLSVLHLFSAKNLPVNILLWQWFKLESLQDHLTSPVF